MKVYVDISIYSESSNRNGAIFGDCDFPVVPCAGDLVNFYRGEWLIGYSLETWPSLQLEIKRRIIRLDNDRAGFQVSFEDLMVSDDQIFSDVFNYFKSAFGLHGDVFFE